MASFHKGHRREVITNSSADDLGPPDPDVPKDAAALELLEHALSSSYIFASLAQDEVTTVARKMVRLAAKAGEDIIIQGNQGETFIVLQEGAADIVVDGKRVGEYGAGASFGELSLLYGAPRAATIRATKACVYWAVHLNTFRRIVIDGHRDRFNTHAAFLRNVKLLDGVSDATFEQIARALEPVGPFDDGAHILREGEPGEDFFLIESGGVRCTHTKRDGSAQELVTLGRGDHFGEMALMLDEPRHANCIAIGEARKRARTSRSEPPRAAAHILPPIAAHASYPLSGARHADAMPQAQPRRFRAALRFAPRGARAAHAHPHPQVGALARAHGRRDAHEALAEGARARASLAPRAAL